MERLHPILIIVILTLYSVQLNHAQQLSIITPTYVNTSVDARVEVLPGGLYGLYGNTVNRRAHVTEQGAQRAWIDGANALPRGLLKRFYVYTDGSDGGSSTLPSSTTRLQIWRPVNKESSVLQLVWQQRVFFNASIAGLYMFDVSADQFRVVDGDLIGWTNEQDYSRISNSVVADYPTYFHWLLNPANGTIKYPLVNTSYVFDNVSYPAMFSVAVELDLTLNCLTCQPYEHMCVSSGRCLLKSDLCLGYQHCLDFDNNTQCDMLQIRNPSLMPKFIQPGGNLTKQSGSKELYGNDVKMRPSNLMSGARRSWIDIGIILPDGVLREFYAYLSGSLQDNQNSRVQLQVWRPVDLSRLKFRLVCLQPVSYANNSEGLYTYSLSNSSDACTTKSGDRLGWAFEGDVGPITYSFAVDARTYFSADDYSQVGTTVTFDAILQPSMYSVAVLVDLYFRCGKVDVRTSATTASSRKSTEITTSSPTVNPTTTNTIVYLAPISVNSTVGARVEVLPGGLYGLYGNNVSQRESVMEQGALRSFIDTNTVLRRGILKRFYVYANQMSSISSPARTRLQIWRPTNVSFAFQLVWQKTVVFNDTIAGLYTFDVSADQFRVVDGDLIGWTNEQDYSPITNSFAQNSPTIFHSLVTVNGVEYPVVNRSFMFDRIPYPLMFSVAVELDLTLAVFLPPLSVNSTVGARVEVLPGGLYGLYGNNVSQRENVMEHGAQRSWIDTNAVLRRGILKRFYVYADRMSSISSPAGTRLQIWRPRNVSFAFKLIWQKTVVFNDTIAGLYTFDVSADQFRVADGDLIGWTNEQDYSPITNSFAQNSPTIFHSLVTVNGVEYPVVNGSFMFDRIPYPLMFSVAVELDMTLECRTCRPYEYPCISRRRCVLKSDLCLGYHYCPGLDNNTQCDMSQMRNSSLMPTSIQRGGYLTVEKQGYKDVYGNSVMKRPNTLTSAAKRSWVDMGIILPDGILREFYVYLNGSVQKEQGSRVQLQVWRPVDLSRPSFRLVCQQAVSYVNNSEGLYTYSLSNSSDACTTKSGDRLGWAFESDVGPITFSYVDSARTYFSVDNDTHSIGSTVAFDSIPVPAAYSVAVLVDLHFLCARSSAVTPNTMSSLTTLILLIFLACFYLHSYAHMYQPTRPRV